MLVTPKILHKALKNLNARNVLIKELNAQFIREKNIYKGVLSFWLGSNVILEQLESGFLYKDYLLAGYHCVLILDKHLSVLDPATTEFILLNQCLNKIMFYYNSHYLLLNQNPRELFTQFKSFFNKIDANLIISKAKQDCHNLIDQVIELNGRLSQKFYEYSTPAVNNNFNSNFINTIITASAKRLPFFWGYLGIKAYQNQKIFIHAKDGMILDGLLVNKPKPRSNTMVIALIGHFQVEHNYLARGVLDFCKMFNADVVFINHRNYALRSYYKANSLDDIAQDIVQFANYFLNKRKQIVLYGMCGGAAHMLLAAEILTKNKVQFKLILDRAFIKYTNFFDYKTLIRQYLLIPAQKAFLIFQFLNFIVMMSAIFLIGLLNVIARLPLMLTNTNINFGNKIHEIPENDILILQGKSKAQGNMRVSQYTDLIVHPRNDLRSVIKSKREQNKDILRKLRNDCTRIMCLYVDSFETQKIFLELADCFDECLQLISNEKLKLAQPGSTDSTVIDIHTHKLFQLTTRNELSMSRFLNGFFAKSPKICDLALDELKSITSDHILEALKMLHPNQESKMDIYSEIANILEIFLTNIKKHENYICHMGNRLFATGLGNINLPLQGLLHCKLYQKAHHNSIIQHQRIILP